MLSVRGYAKFETRIALWMRCGEPSADNAKHVAPRFTGGRVLLQDQHRARNAAYPQAQLVSVPFDAKESGQDSLQPIS